MSAQTAPRDLRSFRQGWVRFVFAFFTSFVAAGYLATISHLAFVAHVRCAEHGALVHVETGNARGVSEQRDAGQTVSRDTLSADDHDHCVVGTAPPTDPAAEHARIREVSLCEVPAICERDAPQVLAKSTPPPRPIDVLFLSPKSSPPS